MTSVTRAELGAGARWRNWGRSVESHPAHVVHARSVDEVQAVVRQARERGLKVKTVGAGHSFTAIAATDDVQLDVSAIEGVLAVDGRLVTLGAGTNLHQLPALLGPLGLALANMGDIDKQTIAGATSTGTHGTGLAFGGIATQIRAATLVTAEGGILRVSASDNAELLPAVALGLGALGVLVDITIECVPAFLLKAVERIERFDDVAEGWLERIRTTDHFEFYIWPHSDDVQSKVNTRLPGDAPRVPLNPAREWVDDVLVSNWVFAGMLNVNRAIPGITPHINRLATKVNGTRTFTDSSQSVFVSPRRTRFVEMEYSIPVEAVPEAAREYRALVKRRGWRIAFPVEVRAASADELWMSTASGRDAGYIAVHSYFRTDPSEYFREVEALMMHFDGRPHWGKMHSRDSASLSTTYARFGDFVALRDRLDPQRTFGNVYLERVLGA